MNDDMASAANAGFFNDAAHGHRRFLIFSFSFYLIYSTIPTEAKKIEPAALCKK